MRNTLLLLSLITLGVQPALGRSLSPDEALSRAMGQARKIAPRSLGARSSVITEPVITIGLEDSPAIYVFNKTDKGFMIVSADEVAAPILGYSDSETIDTDNIPDNLKGWLENCSNQIRMAADAGAEPYSISREADHDPIEPILSTKWDQTTPFNLYCPTYNGFRCVTGCVATAMAQVMKHFEWPTQASADANITYRWRTGQQDLTADFSNYEFEWDHMLDSYKNGYDNTQADAVAKLMQACGYSVDMDYNTASVGSAAFNTVVGKALAQYFKYDQGLHNEPRELYSEDQWENMIYENLRYCGPVVYWGGIHCFVCDGYKSDGYFHFNWGWAGDGDGWFLLDALNPTTVGTGGNSTGYNNDQGALLGIKPAGENISERHYTFYTPGISTVSTTGTWLTINAQFTNYSSFVVEPEWAFRIYSEDGTKHITTVSCNTPSKGEFTLDLNKFKMAGSIPTAQTSDNVTYRVYPALIIDGKEYEFQCPPSMPGYVIYTRNRETPSSSPTYTAILPDVGTKEILDLSSNGNLYIGQLHTKISGIGKFTGDATATMSLTWRLLYANGSEAYLGSNITVNFTPEGKPFSAISQCLIPTSLSPGDYKLVLSYKDNAVNTNDYINMASCDVTLLAKETTSYNATAFTVDNPTAVDPNNIRLSIDITAEAGYAYEDLLFRIYDSDNKNVWEQKSPLYVSAPGSATVSTTASLPDATPGDTYNAKVFKYGAYGSWVDLSETVPFTIAKQGTTGIADITASTVSAYPNPTADFTVITAQAPINRISLFTLSGQQAIISHEIDGCTARLDLSPLTKGIYIAHIATADGSHSIKLIKR